MKNYIGSLLLGAALLSPVIATAQPPVRYYDRDHKDWHQWNDAEARAHRHWLVEERHRPFIEFKLNTRKDQRDYWRWRHDHQDWR